MVRDVPCCLAAHTAPRCRPTAAPSRQGRSSTSERRRRSTSGACRRRRKLRPPPCSRPASCCQTSPGLRAATATANSETSLLYLLTHQCPMNSATFHKTVKVTSVQVYSSLLIPKNSTSSRNYRENISLVAHSMQLVIVG